MDKPLGEWNSLKVTMVGELVTVVINGEVVVDRAPLENYFANAKSGYLAFAETRRKREQGRSRAAERIHARSRLCERSELSCRRGSEVRWRNIFVREISHEEADKMLAGQNAEGFVELMDG